MDQVGPVAYRKEVWYSEPDGTLLWLLTMYSILCFWHHSCSSLCPIVATLTLRAPGLPIFSTCPYHSLPRGPTLLHLANSRVPFQGHWNALTLRLARAPFQHLRLRSVCLRMLATCVVISVFRFPHRAVACGCRGDINSCKTQAWPCLGQALKEGWLGFGDLVATCNSSCLNPHLASQTAHAQAAEQPR